MTPARWAAAVAAVHAAAAEAGRKEVGWRHGLHLWCGFGGSRDAARSAVAAAMEDLYQLPFARFEQYVPVGTPAEVAASLEPFIAAGCRHFNLVPVAGTVEESVDGTADVRARLATLP